MLYCRCLPGYSSSLLPPCPHLDPSTSPLPPSCLVTTLSDVIHSCACGLCVPHCLRGFIRDGSDNLLVKTCHLCPLVVFPRCVKYSRQSLLYELNSLRLFLPRVTLLPIVSSLSDLQCLLLFYMYRLIPRAMCFTNATKNKDDSGSSSYPLQLRKLVYVATKDAGDGRR